MPNEASLERYFVQRMKKKRVLCPKAEKLGVGYPDRMLITSTGAVDFVELKRSTKEKPTKVQLSRHRDLRKRGFQVFLVRQKSDIVEVEEWVDDSSDW